MAKSRLCAIPGCGKPHRARGWCQSHYYRWQRNGSPTGARNSSPRGAASTFFNNAINYKGDDCVLWPFARGETGRAFVHHDGRMQHASRLMCQLIHGDAPSSAHQSAHSCGNGHLGCINWRHLRWATPLENAADALAHGTYVRGARHHLAKLTDDDVRTIRSLAGTMRQKDIGRRFGVDQGAISAIVLRKTWKHVS